MTRSAPAPAFSETLISENQEVWDAMQTHRFVREIADGTLPEPAFHRYLVYEGAFVATAVRIFAFALAKAPTVGDQNWLNGVLSALLGEQFAYFEKAFETVGIDRTGFDADAPGFLAFDRGMHEIACDGTFADIVTAMFCAEWMYWNWCSAALRERPKPGLAREWIEMHTEPAFRAQAFWLKERVDTLGAGSSEGEQRRLVALFAEIVNLEYDFHSAAFDHDIPR